MSGQMTIGVFLCQPSESPFRAVDLGAIAEYARGLPNVAEVRFFEDRTRLEPPILAEHVKSKGFTRLVVAGERPGHFKPAFATAMALAGANPEEVRLASFRENGEGDTGATERAKAVLACAVFGVPFGLAADPDTNVVNPATLVIGGGVAGIQAALEIADAGYQVHLVERTGTIGGHMAMFDKTFPTLDCAACILTPKMVAVGQHSKIKLHVLSEVQEVTGEPGSFKVKVLKHASRVDPAACVACNACTEICPMTAPSEFDVGISPRKAIYIPFPQAVPNSYIVDPEACTWVQSDGKKCGVCLKKCAKDAIHLDWKDETVELDVGNIIVATGYDVFDAKRIERYGYGKYPNVVTGLEFERLTNASGPTGGKIVMKTLRQNKKTKADEWIFEPDGPQPKAVAIIHCVGSRDRNYNAYCSRVCCMYSLKFAHLVREKLPEAKVHEFYIDMRAFGKGYEEFFERIKEEGVSVVRGRSAKVMEANGKLTLRGENIIGDQVIEQPVDMVILSVGLQPTADAAKLGSLLGIAQAEGGWFEEMNYNTEPTSTDKGGIFLAGVCQGPKDIPDTVAQASAVASKVLKSIVSHKVQCSRRRLTLANIEKSARALSAE